VLDLAVSWIQRENYAEENELLTIERARHNIIKNEKIQKMKVALVKPTDPESFAL